MLTSNVSTILIFKIFFLLVNTRCFVHSNFAYFSFLIMTNRFYFLHICWSLLHSLSFDIFCFSLFSIFISFAHLSNSIHFSFLPFVSFPLLFSLALSLTHFDWRYSTIDGENDNLLRELEQVRKKKPERLHNSRVHHLAQVKPSG